MQYILPTEPRESLRSSALHRLHDRWRICGIHRRGRAFLFSFPDPYDDVAAAPLLCAGLIGYRSLRKTGDARGLGIYGFGNAAHLIAQIARYEGRDVFVFTRLRRHRRAAIRATALGAKWAGGSDEMPPEKLDAAIIFASSARSCRGAACPR